MRRLAGKPLGVRCSRRPQRAVSVRVGRGTAHRRSASSGRCSETQIAQVTDCTPSSLAMHGMLLPLHIDPVAFNFINFDEKAKKLIMKGKAQAASCPRKGNGINRDLNILCSDFTPEGISDRRFNHICKHIMF